MSFITRRFKSSKSSWDFSSFIKSSSPVKPQLEMSKVQIANALSLLTNEPSLFKDLPTTQSENSSAMKHIEQLLTNQMPESKKNHVTGHYDTIFKSIQYNQIDAKDFLKLPLKDSKLFLQRIRDESQLKMLFENLFCTGDLTATNAISIIMNPNMKDIDFINDKINEANYTVFLKWSNTSILNFQIVMLNKLNQLGRRHEMIEKLNYLTPKVLPMISAGKISSFHQRIFWKYYISTYKKDTINLINEYPNFVSMFSILEISTSDIIYKVSDKILQMHKSRKINLEKPHLYFIEIMNLLKDKEETNKTSNKKLSEMFKSFSIQYQLVNNAHVFKQQIRISNGLLNMISNLKKDVPCYKIELTEYEDTLNEFQNSLLYENPSAKKIVEFDLEMLKIILD